MSNQDSLDELGGTHDVVQIQLGDEKPKTVESYQVGLSVLTQPSAFAVVLGDGDSVGGLFKRFPPRTPFELTINGRLVQSGLTDSRSAGGAGGAFQIKGRDYLQEIHDSYTPIEKTYKETSHVKLIEAVFEDAGLKTPVIHTSNEALRKAMALGKPLPPPAKAREEIEIPRPVQIKMGDTYYSFLKRVLDRAGLFLFASFDGSYVLTAPAKDAAPIYQVVHSPVSHELRGSVKNYNISDSTVGRVATYVVYARGGGKQFGRVKFRGDTVDKEMGPKSEGGYGYKRTRTFRDWHLQSNDQAELMARRRIAEERRKGWQLTMTVVGHTTVALTGERAVWTPDTMVWVDSDELDLHDRLYLEGVTFERGAQGTETQLHLLRPEDLLFGLEEA